MSQTRSKVVLPASRPTRDRTGPPRVPCLRRSRLPVRPARRGSVPGRQALHIQLQELLVGASGSVPADAVTDLSVPGRKPCAYVACRPSDTLSQFPSQGSWDHCGDATSPISLDAVTRGADEPARLEEAGAVVGDPAPGVPAGIPGFPLTGLVSRGDNGRFGDRQRAPASRLQPTPAAPRPPWRRRVHPPIDTPTGSAAWSCRCRPAVG